MKKISLILLVLIIVAVGASPYIAGRIMEKNYYTFINNLNSLSHGQAKFTGKFVRGFFTSTANTMLNINDNPYKLELTHKVQHGPIIFNFNGFANVKSYIPHGPNLGVITSNFTGEIEKHIKNIYGSNKAYDIISIVSFAGDIATTITSYPIIAKVGASNINWQGANTNIETNLNVSTLKYDMAIPLVDYTDELDQNNKQNLTLSNVDLDIMHVKNLSELLDFKIKSIKIVNNLETYLLGDNIYIKLQQKAESAGEHKDYSAGFTTLSIDGANYGPFAFSITSNNLTDKLLQELLYASMASYRMPQSMLMADMAIIIENKVTFDLILQFTTPEGKINFKMQAVDQTIKQHLEVGQTLIYRLFALYAEKQIHEREKQYFMNNATSKIPNPYVMPPQILKSTVAKWVKMIIGKLQDEKILIANGDNFIIDAIYSKNELTINAIVKSQTDFDKLHPMLEVMPAVSPPPPPA